MWEWSGLGCCKHVTLKAWEWPGDEASSQSCEGRFCEENHKYFVVKIFSDSLACVKIKRGKIHVQYNLTIMWYRVVCLKII